MCMVVIVILYFFLSGGSSDGFLPVSSLGPPNLQANIQSFSEGAFNGINNLIPNDADIFVVYASTEGNIIHKNPQKYKGNPRPRMLLCVVVLQVLAHKACGNEHAKNVSN